MPSEMKRPRQLEEENAKPKKLAADLSLDKAMLQDVLRRAEGQRSYVSRPGKRTDDAFFESLNGTFRAECRNAHWFMSLDDARAKCEAWRRDDNEVRPHGAIGHKPPAALVKRSSAADPP